MLMCCNMKDYLMIFWTPLCYGGGQANCSQPKPKLTCWLFQNVHLNNLFTKIPVKVVSKICNISTLKRKKGLKFHRSSSPVLRTWSLSMSGEKTGIFDSVLWTQTPSVLKAFQRWSSLPYPFTTMCFTALLYITLYYSLNSNRIVWYASLFLYMQ